MIARPQRDDIATALTQLPGVARTAGEVLLGDRPRDRRVLRQWAASLPNSEDDRDYAPDEQATVAGQQAEEAASMIRPVGLSAERQSSHAARLVALSLADAHPLVRVAAAAATIRADDSNPAALAILEDARRRRGDEVGLLASVVSATDLDNRYKRILMETLRGKGQGRPDAAIVHGTWARGGTWWRPDGSFSSFLRDEKVFPRLYAGSEPFEWSGFYSLREALTGPHVDWDRLQAGGLLAWWAELELKKPPDLIGHSYGASVTMSATRVKKRVRGLVLLSPAVHATCLPNPSYYVGALTVRMSLDLVLLADRSKIGLLHGLPNHVERVLPRRGLTGHSATHLPETWRESELDAFVRDEWIPSL